MTRDRVLDPVGIAVVREAGGKTLDEPRAVVSGPQQDSARVRGDVATIEPGHDLVPGRGSEAKVGVGTLCRH